MTSLTSSFHVVLMIFLCNVELFGHFNLCHNRVSEVFLKLFDEFIRNLVLFLIDAPNTTAILRADVRSLPILLCWVVHHEKSF